MYRGGLTSYEKVKKDITLWLKQDKSEDARFTTILDLYALPNDFPRFNEAKKLECYQKIEYLENAFFDDINDPRFIPYIQLHEFEALILVQPEKLSERFPDYENEIQELSNVCHSFSSPELINQGVNTAPSKRIFQFVPTYEKVSAGSLIIQKIGLLKIREKCPHFDRWLTHLEGV